MSSSRSGTRDTSRSSPTWPLDAISEDDELKPCGAQVLQRAQRAALQQLQAALQELLLLERVADLHRRPLGRVVLVELGRCQHGRPADAVAAGARAHEHQQVAHPGRRAADEPVAAGDAQAHGVHEAVLLVGGLEVHLAANRWHADRVAVVPDARHGSVQQEPRARGLQLPEPQRVEHRDRAGAHGEHVAQDPADACGRPLKGLDGARVVVRLDLEGDGQPVAHIHSARVLARAHEQVRPLGREARQELLGVLVGAVLGPHEGEHGQLEPVGLAAELVRDEVVLGVGQAELAVAAARRAGAHAGSSSSTCATSDSNRRPPSAEPVSGSVACSG